MEIVLRDLDRGLVDFPALRDGREVYLCWEEGEDSRSASGTSPMPGFGGRQAARRWLRPGARLERRAAGGRESASVLLIVSTFGPFSFVEAAIVLTGARRCWRCSSSAPTASEFHLPFGDGTVIMAAGLWAGLLIVVRLFDRPLGQNCWRWPAPRCSPPPGCASGPSGPTTTTSPPPAGAAAPAPPRRTRPMPPPRRDEDATGALPPDDRRGRPAPAAVARQRARRVPGWHSAPRHAARPPADRPGSRTPRPCARGLRMPIRPSTPPKPDQPGRDRHRQVERAHRGVGVVAVAAGDDRPDDRDAQQARPRARSRC